MKSFRFRRMLQFSLRTILICLTIACLVFGTYLRRAQNQKLAVRGIGELGGNVTYGFQRRVMDQRDALMRNKDLRARLRLAQLEQHIANFAKANRDKQNWSHVLSAHRLILSNVSLESLPPVPPNLLPTVPSEPPGPKWLRSLLGDEFFQAIVSVSVELHSDGGGQAKAEKLAILLRRLPQLNSLTLKGPVDDDAIKALSSVGRINELVLRGTNISDAGLAYLDDIKHLRRLSLSETLITDDGMASVVKLARLEHLDVSGTVVSDIGLSRLKQLSTLQSLDVSHTAITDDGLEDINSMHHLQSLMFYGTRTSDEAEQEIADKLRMTGSRRRLTRR